MSYKQARIDEMDEHYAGFRKHYDGLVNWCNTSVESGYWTDEEKKDFNPELNGLKDILDDIEERFEKRKEAIQEDIPASFADLAKE